MSAWRHVRTLLVLAHMLAISLMAFPAPSGGMNRSAWKDPSVQAEFKAWRQRLAGWGYELTAEQFEEELWQVASTYMGARTAVLQPLNPYFMYAGTWQSWRMFVGPHTHPARLRVEVERDGAWELVYEGRSWEHTWNSAIFDHDRMRSAVFRYAWARYARTYPRFVDWVAREAREDFPEATRVRVSFFKYRTRSPAEVRAGVPVEGEVILPKVRTLGGEP